MVKLFVEIVILEKLDCILPKNATRPYTQSYKCKCVRTHLCIDPAECPTVISGQTRLISGHTEAETYHAILLTTSFVMTTHAWLLMICMDDNNDRINRYGVSLDCDLLAVGGKCLRLDRVRISLLSFIHIACSPQRWLVHEE
jgi:hypothetical protein